MFVTKPSKCKNGHRLVIYKEKPTAYNIEKDELYVLDKVPCALQIQCCIEVNGSVDTSNYYACENFFECQWAIHVECKGIDTEANFGGSFGGELKPEERKGSVIKTPEQME